MSEVPELWRDETRNCSRPHTVLSHVSPFHALLNVCKVSVIQINSDSFVRHRVGRGWDFSCGAWTANSRLSQVYFQTFLSLSKTCCMFRLSEKKSQKTCLKGIVVIGGASVRMFIGCIDWLNVVCLISFGCKSVFSLSSHRDWLLLKITRNVGQDRSASSFYSVACHLA